MNRRLLLSLYDRSGLGAYMPVDLKGHELEVEEHMEKFAELIVRECLDIIRCDAKNFRGCDIKTDLVVVEEYNKTFKYIKEHFGVRE